MGVEGALESMARLVLLKSAIGSNYSKQIMLIISIGDFHSTKEFLTVSLNTKSESNSFIKQQPDLTKLLLSNSRFIVAKVIVKVISSFQKIN